jgi:threonyl-tRNA synthetase
MTLCDVCLSVHQVDMRSERLGKQIRSAEQDRVPVMCVVGQKEKETNTLSVRARGSGDLGSMTVAELLTKVDAAASSAVEFGQV